MLPESTLIHKKYVNSIHENSIEQNKYFYNEYNNLR